MTTDEVESIREECTQAAKNATEAGFDGVELHSAHGFLLVSFLTCSSKKRADKYGGSIENRRRVVLETIDAIAAAIGSHKTATRLLPFAILNGAFKNDPRHVCIPLL